MRLKSTPDPDPRMGEKELDADIGKGDACFVLVTTLRISIVHRWS